MAVAAPTIAAPNPHIDAIRKVAGEARAFVSNLGLSIAEQVAVNAAITARETAFLNPTSGSVLDLGEAKAPHIFLRDTMLGVDSTGGVYHALAKAAALAAPDTLDVTTLTTDEADKAIRLAIAEKLVQRDSQQAGLATDVAAMIVDGVLATSNVNFNDQAERHALYHKSVRSMLPPPPPPVTPITGVAATFSAAVTASPVLSERESYLRLAAATAPVAAAPDRSGVALLEAETQRLEGFSTEIKRIAQGFAELQKRASVPNLNAVEKAQLQKEWQELETAGQAISDAVKKEGMDLAKAVARAIAARSLLDSIQRNPNGSFALDKEKVKALISTSEQSTITIDTGERDPAKIGSAVKPKENIAHYNSLLVLGVPAEKIEALGDICKAAATSIDTDPNKVALMAQVYRLAAEHTGDSSLPTADALVKDANLAEEMRLASIENFCSRYQQRLLLNTPVFLYTPHAAKLETEQLRKALMQQQGVLTVSCDLEEQIKKTLITRQASIEAYQALWKKLSDESDARLDPQTAALVNAACHKMLWHKIDNLEACPTMEECLAEALTKVKANYATVASSSGTIAATGGVAQLGSAITALDAWLNQIHLQQKQNTGRESVLLVADQRDCHFWTRSTEAGRNPHIGLSAANLPERSEHLGSLTNGCLEISNEVLQRCQQGDKALQQQVIEMLQKALLASGNITWKKEADGTLTVDPSKPATIGLSSVDSTLRPFMIAAIRGLASDPAYSHIRVNNLPDKAMYEAVRKVPGMSSRLSDSLQRQFDPPAAPGASSTAFAAVATAGGSPQSAAIVAPGGARGAG